MHTSRRSLRHRLGSQSPQDNSTWGLARVDVPADVEPGTTTSFVFTATAPAQQGAYPFQWRILQEGVEWFGPATPAMRIVVKGAGEPAECASIRAQLEAINAHVGELAGGLTGDPKRDVPIMRAINRLKAQARTLTAKGQSMGCVISMSGHH